MVQVHPCFGKFFWAAPHTQTFSAILCPGFVLSQTFFQIHDHSYTTAQTNVYISGHNSCFPKYRWISFLLADPMNDAPGRMIDQHKIQFHIMCTIVSADGRFWLAWFSFVDVDMTAVDSRLLSSFLLHMCPKVWLFDYHACLSVHQIFMPKLSYETLNGAKPGGCSLIIDHSRLTNR